VSRRFPPRQEILVYLHRLADALAQAAWFVETVTEA
jgi:hypothetical protein